MLFRSVHEDKLIVGDIISIAHKLNMKTIAEGVENQDQIAYLIDNACDTLQGFHFSKPVAKMAFEKFLTAFQNDSEE